MYTKDEFEKMSDYELTEYAEQMGCEDFIVFANVDGNNEIVNRDEVIKQIIDIHNNQNTWDDESGSDIIAFE